MTDTSTSTCWICLLGLQRLPARLTQQRLPTVDLQATDTATRLSPLPLGDTTAEGLLLPDIPYALRCGLLCFYRRSRDRWFTTVLPIPLSSGTHAILLLHHYAALP